jgi:hypothetical protein
MKALKTRRRRVVPVPMVPAAGLLPCPFCGAEGVHAKEGFGGDGFVVKYSRGAHPADPDLCTVAPSTLPHISPKDAENSWNARRGKKQKAA